MLHVFYHTRKRKYVTNHAKYSQVRLKVRPEEGPPCGDWDYHNTFSQVPPLVLRSCSKHKDWTGSLLGSFQLRDQDPASLVLPWYSMWSSFPLQRLWLLQIFWTCLEKFSWQPSGHNSTKLWNVNSKARFVFLPPNESSNIISRQLIFSSLWACLIPQAPWVKSTAQ